MATRRRPEDFLELVEQAKRGRLKLYLGFAAGVGKTYRMLEEAHELAQRGIDIVVGFVESHGRAETEALLPGLEVVPRRRVSYRNVQLEEMDLDAILARKPQVALVDEIAHSNAPGSKHRRRFEDVLELLDAGINVIAALNVQHLESLNDLVTRTTGVQVRETVPDTFLQRADQVISLDLAVEDLLDRLRVGKIYAPEKVAWALAHFFRDQNLATLRELALREVAESLDRSKARTTSREGGEGDRTGAKVMVCISSRSPRAGPLLRRGSRMAGRLNTDWYAVYVETPREAPDRIDSEAQRILHRNIEKARELGAQVVRLQSVDPVTALLDFARTHGVGQVLIGRTEQPRWKSLLGRGFVQRMVREAEGLDLHIVSFEPGPGETPP
jgi:two-component system sensor histidine kinase KdpD